jgi:hypothetical protein
LIFNLFSLINASGAEDEIVVNEVSVDPKSPRPLSTITIIVDITGENISRVQVMVKECSEKLGICFNEITADMIEIEAGEFQATVTLENDKTTYIQPHFVITSHGISHKLEDDSWKINLSLDSADGGQTNGGDGTNSTPGFEMLLFLTVLLAVTLLVKRKRLG